jgi:outer membrane lipopolysaccharide assembly protein LptE/RlpB
MSNRNKIIWLSVIFVIAFAGCGYHFPGSGAFPKGVDRIFVEVLENRTNETGVENIITRNLIDEFVLRESKSIAGSINDADSILSGSVSKIKIHTISAKGRDSASERRVTVSVNLNLADKDGKVIWKANGLSDDQAYSVSDDKNLTERNKRVAIGFASRRIAERALNRLTDDF